MRVKAALPPKPKSAKERLAELKANVGGGGVDSYLEKVKSRRGLDAQQRPVADDGSGGGGEDDEKEDDGKGVMKSLRNVFGGGRKGKGGTTNDKTGTRMHWLHTSYR